MEHKIILKCRVCLDDFDEQEMFDLFTEKRKSGGGSSSRLSEKVEYCCGVKLRESSEMPSKICMKCFDMTRIWYNFRQLCVFSQVYLESLCAENNRPKDFDNGYIELSNDDLQLFRSSVHQEHSELELNESCSENDFDATEDFHENVHEVTIGSDDVKNIKKEKNNSPNLEILPKEAKGITMAKSKVTVRKKHRKHTSSPTSYMCSICGNVYKKKTTFHYHMSIHSNTRPHECELCGKTFRQTSELKNHMRRHTGERPYKCTYCDRHFIDRSEKHRHERVHTNTRPYQCKICGKSFMYSAILKNHSKLHSGEKEFNCIVCHKAFTLQHQLKAHLQTITHKQKEAQFVGAGYEVMYE